VAAHGEPEAPEETANELAAELHLMADWLGLTKVQVAKRGDMATKLAAAI
jgi:uncharacterized protein YcaQ